MHPRKPVDMKMEKSQMNEFKVQTLADFMNDPSPEPARRSAAPGERKKRRAKVRGTNLHKVLWTGREWAVTAYGIEARDGRYAIDKRYLAEQHGSWSWPMHMAEKGWVDLEDFIEAWLVALEKHRAEMAPEDIARAIRKALRCAGLTMAQRSPLAGFDTSAAT
jgi:hypothetical protein